MNKKGFTLTEMLIVVIIISGLMLLIVPNLGNTKGNVDQKTCDAFVSLVDSQIQSYYLEKGVYPASIDSLFQEGYIRSTTCQDGTPILIVNQKAQKGENPITSSDVTGQ